MYYLMNKRTVFLGSRRSKQFLEICDSDSDGEETKRMFEDYQFSDLLVAQEIINSQNLNHADIVRSLKIVIIECRLPENNLKHLDVF